MPSFTKSAAILLGLVAGRVACSKDRCTSFATSISIPNTKIIAHNYLPNGTSIFLPGTAESCYGPDPTANATANLCRLALVVSTSSSSKVQVEAWLPDPQSWNGRLLATGDGGIGGCIDYVTMQNGAELGFAAFGTNAGHNGSVGYEFFLNKPQVINDFGHRAIHVEAEVGKELVRQYYRTKATKNYYAGCSTGGRQGFQNAYLYPEDFDGLLLGSPAIDWLHVVASKGIIARRIGWPHLDSPAYIRPEQWAAIVEAQIRQLDPLDGVVDGIIDEPTKLRFDPESLVCGTGALNSSMCLSPLQVESVRRAYEPIASASGQIVYPAFELGSNTDVFSANQENGTAQLGYTTLQDFWRGAVYNNSNWTPDHFRVSDMDFALRINPGQVNADDTDLSRFYRRGGKIMSYHGRNDETVTSALSEQFFAGVQRALHLSLDEIHDFYRLFFIPGLHHCSGGPGAWSIGNVLLYPYDKRLLDPEHNALVALVEWVEKGRTPKTLIGTKYENDDVGGTILGQRTYCPYPMVSKWNGVGDTRLATSWKCIFPGR
ncbi:tannase and feruloyl esterase [Annulohypoxylon truncatum]|uniref:tannase and feruloyl esterase n=1 Tax=Annulohypoxylon truncatum TaxID=327061 RepID=UPI002007C5A0|nr:tannase and feruloyl esterase [Annulohypoxylon truncatum]KAI1214499.1 tannase and feruloyl esterase [Annulohypoxylon truncatum]